MNYETTKQKKQELRSKERNAREELKALQDRQSSIDSDLQNAYDNYLQAQAGHKAGECTESDVSKAERAYLKLKDEKDSLSKEIEA
ncbi:MAG: hypothetical protein FH748_08745 [Balneolaceae bacterium]|nr:hypothetical protein [Balneolaceae bacterium]